MSDHIFWLIELNVKPGEFDNVKALMQEMSDATQSGEPNAFNYEWFISEDETVCHIYERYADSAAVMTHLGNFMQKFADRFLAILEPTRLMVYGNPSDEAIQALNNFGAVYMKPLGGYAR